MLSVEIYCVGTLKEQYLRDAMAEYAKRLSAFCRFGVREVKEELLLSSLPPKAYKIALCIEGTQRSSEELAELMDALPSRGISSVIFVIGGFDGLCEAVKSACDLRLSFSRMTFPHQLMRVILAEQIYRAFTIINHGKYHK